ncbi:MAG TPA: response regulator, partial [Polyangiales bacterium]|nr:response regulator [Polyangiales bacterium]
MSDGLTVLLIEDDAAHAEIARRNLSPYGLRELVHADDGQAALDLLFGGGLVPDLILLDLRLPRVDGFEVLRRVKAEAALRHVPVIVLTTSSAEADVCSAYKGGASSYLVKPVDFERFVAMMRAFGAFWLDHNRMPH